MSELRNGGLQIHNIYCNFTQDYKFGVAGEQGYIDMEILFYQNHRAPVEVIRGYNVRNKTYSK